MAQFAVIGLGSFGATVAQELTKLNHDVIGIDTVKKNVENLADVLTHAVIADATDEHVLDELNIQNCDAVVVAIGEDIEASILCVLNLKNLGIDKIWVKAKTKAHHTILSHSISIKSSSRRRHGCTCCTSTQLPYGEPLHVFR